MICDACRGTGCDHAAEAKYLREDGRWHCEACSQGMAEPKARSSNPTLSEWSAIILAAERIAAALEAGRPTVAAPPLEQHDGAGQRFAAWKNR